MQRLSDGDLTNNRFSEGGINLLDGDFNQLEQYVKSGTKVYVLPEDPNNKIVAKNGQLNMVQKEFTGLVLTSKKNRTAQQLKIDLKAEGAHAEAMKGFTKALVDQKPALMKKTGIDNDTYNNLATLALGIAGQESKFGESKNYWLKEHCQMGVSAWKRIRGLFGKKSSPVNSRGLTQIKLEVYMSEKSDPDTKKLLEEYKVTKDSLNKPEISATATMIILANMYKNELPDMKEEMQKLNVSKEDALLYLWQGKKDYIKPKKGAKPRSVATPSENSYIIHAKRYVANDFTLSQTNRPTEVELPKEIEQVAAPSAAESETAETK